MKKFIIGVTMVLVALTGDSYEVQAQKSSEEIICDAISVGNKKFVEAELNQLIDSEVNTEYINRCLMHAIRADKKDIVGMLLSWGANVNYRGEDGDTPFISAFSRGKLETAKLLLAQGADINAVDGKGATALKVALLTEEVCQPENITFLLARGADIDAVTQKEFVLNTIRNKEVFSMMRPLFNAPQIEYYDSKAQEERVREAYKNKGLGLARISLRQLYEGSGKEVSSVQVSNQSSTNERIGLGEAFITFFTWRSGEMGGRIPAVLDFVTSSPEQYSIGDKVRLKDADTDADTDATKVIEFTIKAKRGLCVKGTVPEDKLQRLFTTSLC